MHVCLISLSTFFSQTTMVNYQVTVLLDRLLSNGLAILGANQTYFYIHTVCVQVAITQIRLYICTGKTFFLFIYSISGNFSQAGSIVFFRF